METYDFTLRYSLGQHDGDSESLIENLSAEGCTDALVGIGMPGRIAINFTRKALSADAAVLSALADVQRAIPNATLIEATPDLVGLTDIAQLLGFSRQYMRKLVVKKGSGFPPPVHDGKPAIWHLATVLSWFADNELRTIDAALLNVARVNMQCNLYKEAASLDERMSSRLEKLVQIW
jgi:hypothetical protein